MAVYLYGLKYNIDHSPLNDTIFYVGVGLERRMNSHWKFGKKGKHRNSFLQQVFNEHIKHDKKPKAQILVVCQNHEYAFNIEKKLIAKLGRKYTNDGLLCNISKGGEGPDSSLMSSLEIRKKVSLGVKKAFLNPVVKEKHKNSVIETSKTEEYKRATSIGTKKALNTPEIRKKHLEALSRINSELDSLSRSISQKKHYEQHPERKEKISTWAKEYNARPEIKKIKSESTTKANLATWSNPIIRDRRIEGMKGKKKTMTQAAIDARRKNAKKRCRDITKKENSCVDPDA